MPVQPIPPHCAYFVIDPVAVADDEEVVFVVLVDSVVFTVVVVGTAVFEVLVLVSLLVVVKVLPVLDATDVLEIVDVVAEDPVDLLISRLHLPP